MASGRRRNTESTKAPLKPPLRRQPPAAMPATTCQRDTGEMAESEKESSRREGLVEALRAVKTKRRRHNPQGGALLGGGWALMP